MYHPDDLNNALFSHGYVLEVAPRMGAVGGLTFQEQGAGWGASHWQGPVHESMGSGHALSMTSS